MRAVVIIPARYESSRFPGKPLAKIAGKSLIHRTWLIGKACPSADEVVVATDDQRIAQHVKEFGGSAVLTSRDCENGSERALEAAMKLSPVPEIVINLQGDSPLTPPWIVEELCAFLKSHSQIEVATPAVRVTEEFFLKMGESSRSGKAGGTFVVRDLSGRALYFSKAPIPFLRNRREPLPLFKHLGLYGYKTTLLERYVALEPGILEQIEGLEQLRLLEHGIPLQVLEASFRGRDVWSVDSPEDVSMVEEILSRQGEFVSLDRE